MLHLRSDYDQIQDASGKIPEDEPVFLLRAKDPSAPAAVRAWADDAEQRGADPELIRRVRIWANDMGLYQQPIWEEGHKVADVPEGALKFGNA